MPLAFDVVEVESTWYRLIPSRFPPVDLYERVAPEGDRLAIHVIEELTNPRVQQRKAITGIREIDEASPRFQNWNHAPFAYLNPEGTWLLPPIRGALELSDSVSAALAWSVRRRETFLARTAEPALDLDMRLLSTMVRGRFADLRDLPPELDCKSRWERGAEALKSGVDGALFQSPTTPAATCISVFVGDVLGRSLQGEHYRFVWDGARIRSIYGFEKGQELRPEVLFQRSPAAA